MVSYYTAVLLAAGADTRLVLVSGVLAATLPGPVSGC